MLMSRILISYHCVSVHERHKYLYSMCTSFQTLKWLLFLFLCIPAVGAEEYNVLWIAMAGTHQIWALFLADGKLPKGR